MFGGRLGLGENEKSNEDSPNKHQGFSLYRKQRKVLQHLRFSPFPRIFSSFPKYFLHVFCMLTHVRIFCAFMHFHASLHIIVHVHFCAFFLCVVCTLFCVCVPFSVDLCMWFSWIRLVGPAIMRGSSSLAAAVR